MKLLIMPFIDRLSAPGQETERVSSERLINALKTVSAQKRDQTIELQNDQSARVQIDSVLETLDINTLLEPTMPNTGSMEVLVAIKRNLSLELETLLAARKN